MDIVTKIMQDEYNALQTVHHMNFVQRPPNNLLIDWCLSTCCQDKDIDYWYTIYKKLQEYTVPKIEYITLRTVVERSKEDEEHIY